jgi:hypothetical protein
MALDPSIYGRNPLINIADSIQGWQGVDLNRQRLAAGKMAAQENALAMQQKQQAMMEAQQIKNALAGLSPDATEEDIAAAALRTRLPGGIKMADEIRKAAGERGYKKAQTDREVIQGQKDQEEIVVKRAGLYKDMLARVNDKSTGAMWIQAQYQDPVLSKIVGAIPMEQALSRIPDDPKEFQKWRDAQGMGLTAFVQNQTTQAHNKATETGQQATREETARAHRAAEADRAAARQQAERHFNTRMEFDKSKEKDGSDKPPVAVLDKDGNAVYVSRAEAIGKTPATMGVELSPKDKQKREAAYPKATATVTGFETTSDTLIKDLQTLKVHPGLPSITGIAAGRLPGITAAGRAAQALYDKIVARGGFQELADMRAASPTGGALGQVSNMEGQQLRSAFAALDRRQDAPAFQKAVDDAISKVNAAKQNVRDAYELTYEYKAEKKPKDRPPLDSFNR